MDEKHLARGLAALADEHVARTVDVDQIAAIARFRRRRGWTVAGAAIGVVVLVAGLFAIRRAGPVHPPEPTVAAVPGKWTLTDLPVLEPNQPAMLSAVAATNGSDAWAVGRIGDEKADAALSSRSLVVRWNGRQWQRFDLPGGSTLWDVAARTAADVWVVGAARATGGGYTAHWDGRTWTEHPGPVPDGMAANQSITLYGIAARSATDVWAVGCSDSVFGRGSAIIQHWDGRQWRLLPVPDQINGHNVCLNSVAAVAENDVWAVGARPGEQGSRTPLALHWDGQRWSVVEPAGPFGEARYGSFTKVVALGADDVWAFGGFVEFAQRWDGKRWQHVPGPSESEFEVMAAAPDGRGGLVVGTRPATGVGLMNLRRWDGKTWTVYPVLAPENARSGGIPGLGVAPGTDTLWAVGWRAGGRATTPQPLAALTSLAR